MRHRGGGPLAAPESGRLCPGGAVGAPGLPRPGPSRGAGSGQLRPSLALHIGRHDVVLAAQPAEAAQRDAKGGTGVLIALVDSGNPLDCLPVESAIHHPSSVVGVGV